MLRVLKNYGVVIFCCASLLVNVATWAVLVIGIPYTDQTVFLHYNIYFGIDLAGSWYQLFWIPGSGTAILLLNFLLLHILRVTEPFMRSIILALTFASQLALLVASIFITIVNS